MSLTVSRVVGAVPKADGWQWESEVDLAKIPPECVDWPDGRVIRWCCNAGILTGGGQVVRQDGSILITVKEGRPLLVIWLD